jgi:hypothetical protein
MAHDRRSAGLSSLHEGQRTPELRPTMGMSQNAQAASPSS